MASQDPARKCVIVLIHGTFASGASWIRPESRFSGYLLDTIGEAAVILPFVWSGHNSHRARIQAGVELGELLRNSPRNHPNWPHFLVAHSHGGNVALYAMRDPEVVTAVAGLVFMGTPFILVEPRQLPANAENLFRLAGFGVGFVALIVAIRVFINILVPASPDIVLYMLLPLLVLVPFWSGLLAGRWLSQNVPGWVIRTQQAIQHRLQLASANKIPKFNVIVDLDEARLYLRFLAGLSNIPAHLFGLIRSTASFEATLFGILFLLIGAALQGTVGVYLVLLPVALIVLWLLLPMLQILMQVVPKFIRAHGAGFGGESFIDNWLARIAIVTAPPGTDDKVATYKVPQRELAKQTPGRVALNHSSIYQSAEVVGKIGDWIKSKV